MNLVPLNLQEEKKKFLFDPNYNPQFVYEEPITQQQLYRHGPFGGELTIQAKVICDTVIKKWGTESKFLDETEGRLLTKAETESVIHAYLQHHNLQNIVSLRFSEHFIPRTAIDGYEMKIRLPIDYREKGIKGVLHHEIGTHVLRRLNEEKQPWHEKREMYGFKNHRETEEGLATLHSYIEKSESLMWYTSVQYYACSLAPSESFSGVYKALRPYLDDPERRWNVTMRAKRGIADTSEGGGYTKDQVYLRGVVSVGKWLVANNFELDKLYVGKIAVEDAQRFVPIAIQNGLYIPTFYSDDPARYKKKILTILETNNLL